MPEDVQTDAARLRRGAPWGGVWHTSDYASIWRCCRNQMELTGLRVAGGGPNPPGKRLPASEDK